MKYQVGDKVLILHSNEEGEILDILNDKMLLVDVKGVSFPVYMDQVDFPYFKRFTEKKIVKAPKQKAYIDDIRKEKGKPEEKEDGVWLTFLPVLDLDEFGDEVVEELKVHLVNRTKQVYNFTYCLTYFGKKDFELKNQINPFEDFYIHDIPFEHLNDNPVFEFEFTLDKPDKKKAEYFETNVKLKPKQVFNRIEELKKKNEAMFSYALFEKYPDKIIDDKEKFGHMGKGQRIYDISKLRQMMEQPRSVVDLHIEKLTDNWRGMSNYEMLELQLKTFEKYYALAISHVQPSFIIIHGVGSGKLRDEIHDLLKHRKEVKSFVNQYDSRFGYGATEIFFQY